MKIKYTESLTVAYNHPLAVVVAEDADQLAMLMSHAESEALKISEHLNAVDQFPIGISLADPVVGWVDQMDRALYYIHFDDFMMQTANI